MGEHRDPAGGTDQLDSEGGIGRVVLHVIARARGEDGAESLGPVLNNPGGDQRVGDVGSPQGGPGRDVVDDVIPGQRIVLGEQADHPLGAGIACILGLGDFLQQPGRLRVVQIAEQVDTDAL
jgi:hypothetical protein